MIVCSSSMTACYEDINFSDSQLTTATMTAATGSESVFDETVIGTSATGEVGGTIMTATGSGSEASGTTSLPSTSSSSVGTTASSSDVGAEESTGHDGDSTGMDGSAGEGGEEESDDDAEGTTTNDEGDDGDEAEDDSAASESDLCDGVTCFNGGECIAGECSCQNGFDPDSLCAVCLDPLIEVSGTCVPDRCRNNPCNIGGEGHGKSCEVTGPKREDYACTCFGDYDEATDCEKCEAGKVPKSGHECQIPLPDCQGVVCRTGASCDADTGECRCDDADAFMDESGACHDPCGADPCHIADGGHGLTCTNIGVSTYECTCDGGRTPASDCEDCRPGTTDVGGQCVLDCSFHASSCDGT